MTQKIPHNVQRIDHIVLIMRPENADAAVDRFEQVLGITFTERYDVEQLGLRSYIDWTAGIEILTPVDPSLATEYADYLDKHGEGLFRLVFGVANLEESLTRVESLGMKVGNRIDVLQLFPQWTSTFSRLEQTVIEPVHGVGLTLGQIEPR